MYRVRTSNQTKTSITHFVQLGKCVIFDHLHKNPNHPWFSLYIEDKSNSLEALDIHGMCRFSFSLYSLCA